MEDARSGRGSDPELARGALCVCGGRCRRGGAEVEEVLRGGGGGVCWWLGDDDGGHFLSLLKSRCVGQRVRGSRVA